MRSSSVVSKTDPIPVQAGLPVEVTDTEIARQKSLGAALELCWKVAGLEPKEVQGKLKLDQAQCSRWVAGTEGVIWPRLDALMTLCGNDAPVRWMVLQTGYDLHSLRLRETALERELRLQKEENAALRRLLLGGQS